MNGALSGLEEADPEYAHHSRTVFGMAVAVDGRHKNLGELEG
jgi:hypothetical protein